MKIGLNLGILGALASGTLLSMSAWGAAPVAITVLNPSFQLQDASVANGGNKNPILDWSDASNPAGNVLGVHFYNSGQYTLVNGPDGTGPVGADGSQGIFDDVSSPVFQTLSSDLSLGTYTLTVASGQRLAGPPYGGGSIALDAGTTLLKSVSLVEPTAGTFTDTTLTFTALAGNLELGEPLQIDLQGTGNGSGSSTVDFDNVRLDFTAAAVPEPSTWMMIVMGGVALVAGVRRLRAGGSV